jgi:hypothetical protein
MFTAHFISRIQASPKPCWPERFVIGLRAALLALACPVLLSSPTHAQELQPASKPQALIRPMAATVPNPASSSGWLRLSQKQRRALAPLAATWDSLSQAHQRKWLVISKNYPGLNQSEKAKMHERMTEWAALNPQERAQARLNFGKTAEISKELTPAEKLAKWQAYQALPPEQRQELSDKAKTRPLGAAPAVKPVPPQKLALVPPVTTAKATKSGDVPAAPAEPTASN